MNAINVGRRDVSLRSSWIWVNKVSLARSRQPDVRSISTPHRIYKGDSQPPVFMNLGHDSVSDRPYGLLALLRLWLRLLGVHHDGEDKVARAWYPYDGVLHFWPATKRMVYAGLAIVEAGEGRLGLFCILDATLAGKDGLCYYIRGSEGESSNQWQLRRQSH